MNDQANTAIPNQKPQRPPGIGASLQDKSVLAQYIADWLLRLRNLAKANNFRTVLRLLDVTYDKAFGAPPKKKFLLESLSI